VQVAPGSGEDASESRVVLVLILALGRRLDLGLLLLLIVLILSRRIILLLESRPGLGVLRDLFAWKEGDGPAREELRSDEGDGFLAGEEGERRSGGSESLLSGLESDRVEMRKLRLPEIEESAKVELKARRSETHGEDVEGQSSDSSSSDEIEHLDSRRRLVGDGALHFRARRGECGGIGGVAFAREDGRVARRLSADVEWSSGLIRRDQDGELVGFIVCWKSRGVSSHTRGTGSTRRTFLTSLIVAGIAEGGSRRSIDVHSHL
jgi:hypothetical protein